MITYPTNVELKRRYIGTTPIGRVYIGNNLIWDTKDGYGVRWIHDGDGTMERIGNMRYHRTLPIQSKMRRCTIDTDGTIKYISNTNYKKYTDNTDVPYSTLNTMVEVPEHYCDCGQVVENGVTYDYIMLYPNANVGKHIPIHYIGAFEAALDRTNNKLYSIVKTNIEYVLDNGVETKEIYGQSLTFTDDAADFRGGNNDTSYTGAKTLLGRPVTNINISNFCTYAKNTGSKYCLYNWEAHMSLYRLFIVEYATFDSQATFNPILTAEGYHQGGLGFGVCSNKNEWNNYNAHNPIHPCGVTLILGNETGNVKYNLGTYTTPVSYSSETYFNVPSYRGVENPFGHIWKIINGIYTVVSSSVNYIFTSTNGWSIRDFNYGTSISTPAANHELRTNLSTAKTQGWQKTILFDNHGDILPKELNNTDNTTSSKAITRDYFWQSYANGQYKAVVGGSLNNGVRTGLGSLDVQLAVAGTSEHGGSRLLYIPSL
ncbi:MAG: hypothetical protein IJG68_01980 [Bacilli bacterium]|nr:hypothetical protein [Bacilli bacterium]